MLGRPSLPVSLGAPLSAYRPAVRSEIWARRSYAVAIANSSRFLLPINIVSAAARASSARCRQYSASLDANMVPRASFHPAHLFYNTQAGALFRNQLMIAQLRKRLDGPGHH